MNWNWYYLIFFIIFITYIWFDTFAIQEYAEKLGIKFFKRREWIDSIISKSSIQREDYHSFLQFKYNCFLVRLITCPVCLIVWLNIIGYLIFRFNFFTIGASIFFSWIGYFLLRIVILFKN